MKFFHCLLDLKHYFSWALILLQNRFQIRLEDCGQGENEENHWVVARVGSQAVRCVGSKIQRNILQLSWNILRLELCHIYFLTILWKPAYLLKAVISWRLTCQGNWAKARTHNIVVKSKEYMALHCDQIVKMRWRRGRAFCPLSFGENCNCCCCCWQEVQVGAVPIHNLNCSQIGHLLLLSPISSWFVTLLKQNTFERSCAITFCVLAHHFWAQLNKQPDLLVKCPKYIVTNWYLLWWHKESGQTYPILFPRNVTSDQ